MYSFLSKDIKIDTLMVENIFRVSPLREIEGRRAYLAGQGDMEEMEGFGHVLAEKR